MTLTEAAGRALASAGPTPRATRSTQPIGAVPRPRCPAVLARWAGARRELVKVSRPLSGARCAPSQPPGPPGAPGRLGIFAG